MREIFEDQSIFCPTCLRCSKEIIAASNSRVVLGALGNEGMVIKTRGVKGEDFTLPTFEKAQSDVLDNKSSQLEVRKTLEALGHSPRIIPISDFVIHELDGKVAIAQVQERIKGRSLAKFQRTLLRLPDKSLEDLRAIFEVNLKLLKDQKTSLDIVGSKGYMENPLKRVFYNLFPFFFSENVILDKECEVRLIDIEDLQKVAKVLNKGIRGRIKKYLKFAGSYNSLAIINLILFLRKIGLELYLYKSKRAGVCE